MQAINKLIFLLSVIVFGSASIVKAQQNKTLLWEISGRGLTKPSYIFGTMHVLCNDDAAISPNLEKVIQTSEQIVFEIDLDDQQQMMNSIKYLRMNDGLKLSDIISEKEYARIQQYFSENKIPIPLTMMNRFKPYFISALISERMMGCEKTNGMEQQIMSKAGEKDIFGLETMEFQSSIFDSIPYHKQAKDLLKYVDSIDNYRKVTLEMAKVYREQDLDKIEKLINKSDPGMEQYMDLMLYNRNRDWIDKIQSYMVEKPTLVAVGAGHLPGKQGVLALLKAKGYTVKPIKN
jgi:uncharacterized protein